jgi:hypothetical protein
MSPIEHDAFIQFYVSETPWGCWWTLEMKRRRTLLTKSDPIAMEID